MEDVRGAPSQTRKNADFKHGPLDRGSLHMHSRKSPVGLSSLYLSRWQIQSKSQGSIGQNMVNMCRRSSLVLQEHLLDDGKGTWIGYWYLYVVLSRYEVHSRANCPLWPHLKAGQFSASVTAFIESYKFLKPDQDDATVAILAIISMQLVRLSRTYQNLPQVLDSCSMISTNSNA